MFESDDWKPKFRRKLMSIEKLIRKLTDEELTYLNEYAIKEMNYREYKRKYKIYNSKGKKK